jgi:hypothetical protein
MAAMMGIAKAHSFIRKQYMDKKILLSFFIVQEKYYRFFYISIEAGAPKNDIAFFKQRYE